MVSSDFCGLCDKIVRNNHRAIKCDICEKWIHAKCNHINKTRYETFIETADLKWNCFKCDQEVIPFSNSSNEEFKLTMQGKNPNIQLLDEVGKEDSHIIQTLNSTDLFNDDELSNQSYYYTISEMNDIKTKANPLSFFHTNIASLSYYFDVFETILSNFANSPDFIGITETRIKKGNKSAANTEIEGYEIVD